MKDIIARHPTLEPFLTQFSDWFETWAAAVAAPDRVGARFRDIAAEQMNPRDRDYSLRRIRERVVQIVSIAQREAGVIDRTSARRAEEDARIQQTEATSLQQRMLEATYVGPGDLREGGPRHNNDFVDISKIQVAPSDEELLCQHVFHVGLVGRFYRTYFLRIGSRVVSSRLARRWRGDRGHEEKT